MSAHDWAPGPQDVPHDDDGEDYGDGLVTVALTVIIAGVAVILGGLLVGRVAYLWLLAR